MTVFHGEFKSFKDPALLTRNLAERVRELLEEGIRCRGQASLVVSGGTTPVPLFETLSAMDIAWERIVITLADERWVEPNHPDSNEGLVRRYLLKNRAAAARFVRLKTMEATASAGEAACSRHIQEVPLPFDILILGMGGDGHTASLFPGSAELSQAMNPGQNAVFCMAVTPPAASHDRMTLTLPTLLNSRQIFVHITGASKRQVFEKALAGDVPEDMPIRAVLGQARVPVTVWWAP